MKILLSAFSCLPNRGSEPGVGWNWAIALAKQGHEVTVYTQTRYRAQIEAELERFGKYPNFVFIKLLTDGPIPFGTIGHYIYYYLWQTKLLIHLMLNGQYKQYDIIHHITYGGIRTGSLLFLLPVRFIFGPMGGGERCPLNLVYPSGPKALFFETLRNILNILAFIDPIYVLMQRKADMILCKTNETKHTVFPFYSAKAFVCSEIGIDTHHELSFSKSEEINILFAGKLIYWKGLDILFDALKKMDLTQIKSRLKVTVVGKGVMFEALSKRAAEFSTIEVLLTGHINQEDLFSHYKAADIFVFPSLHDSSGNVVLEAMSFGLPVVCLNLGGPPLIVGKSGICLNVHKKTYDDVSQGLANAISELVRNTAKRHQLSQLAHQRASAWTWDTTVDTAYSLLQKNSTLRRMR